MSGTFRVGAITNSATFISIVISAVRLTRILAKPNWTRPYSRSQSGEVHEGGTGAGGIDRFLGSGRGLGITCDRRRRRKAGDYHRRCIPVRRTTASGVAL